MASGEHHIQTGKDGEKIALDFLIKKGYQILEKNYRFKRSEIDVIAIHSNQLIFIEVKARRSDKYGFPEEAVTNKKLKLIKVAAENYIYERDWQGLIRFDVISISLEKNTKIVHLEDISF